MENMAYIFLFIQADKRVLQNNSIAQQNKIK